MDDVVEFSEIETEGFAKFPNAGRSFAQDFALRDVLSFDDRIGGKDEGVDLARAEESVLTEAIEIAPPLGKEFFNDEAGISPNRLGDGARVVIDSIT